jgi:uncharacterized protein
VYIQELPSGNRTITPVATSITAFIGIAPRGQTDQVGPVLVQNWGEYQAQFGGLAQVSNMSYAVNQFFQNGGSQAVIVRLSKGTPTIFSVPAVSWTLQAANPGSWGNNLAVTIDTMVDPGLYSEDNYIFNLNIKDNNTGYSEKFLNVSLNQASPYYVASVLENESQLLSVTGYPQTNIAPQPPTTPLMPQNTAATSLSIKTSGADNYSTAVSLTDFQGDGSTTGIYALQKADLFNLLCIPPYAYGVDTGSGELYTGVYPLALSYFSQYQKRAMLLVDPPSDWNSVSAAVTGITTNTNITSLRNEDSAIYFPRIEVADPLWNNNGREFVPCGAVAGVIAQTDAQRGVWKAPAGLEANLTGIMDLTDGGYQVRMSDMDNGQLNPLGVNCLRIKPVVGPVVWGARTMEGADMLSSQWKYLPIRRTAQFIEESLYRGTQWVVFEPNDEPLWKSIRLSVGAFMQQLFLQGAFQGSTPSQAYLVKCDSETNPQYLIDQGIVTILVGFAPLYPAEFVVLQIQQLTAQGGS